MSKWQNPAWAYTQPPQGNAGTWHNPAKPTEPYTYAPPPQTRPYVPPQSVPGEADNGHAGATSSPKNAYLGPAAVLPQTSHDVPTDETVPRPMMQLQPYPPMRTAYIAAAPLGGPPLAHGQYAPMPMYPYPMVPPEHHTYGGYAVPSEQWEPLAPGFKHPPATGGIPGSISVNMMPESQLHRNYERRMLKASSASSPATDPASMRDSETSAMDSLHLQSLSGSKPTKRLRMGCLTCRQRKKRCCETRPQCTECLRLRLKCVWPKPGTEHKNKPKEVKSQENMIDHDIYGKIKVLRGIVEYRSD